MAAPNTSMSALGDFYEAVADLSQRQAQKYGKEAKPDMIISEFGTGVASGVAELAATFGVSETIAREFSDTLTDKARGYLADGWSANLNIGDWFPGLLPTRAITLGEISADEYGNYYGVDTDSTITAAPTMKVDLNEVLDDPRGIAVKAADKYWDAQRTIMRLKAIAGAGNHLQAAITERAMNADNVDKDIIGTVTMARAGVNETAASTADRRDKVLVNSLSMYAGLTEESDRNLVAGVGDQLMKEVATAYHNKAASYPTITYPDGSTGSAFPFKTKAITGVDAEDLRKNANASFAALFKTEEDKGNLLTHLPGDDAKGHGRKASFGEDSQDDFFEYDRNAGLGPMHIPAKGALLKESFQSGIQNMLSDPSVRSNPALRRSLMQMYSSFDDEGRSKAFFETINKAANNGYKDMSHVVEFGLTSVANEHSKNGDMAEAAKLAEAGTMVRKLDGTMTWGDSAAYMYLRFKDNGLMGAGKMTLNALLTGNKGDIKALVTSSGIIGGAFNALKNRGNIKIGGSKSFVNPAAILSDRERERYSLASDAVKNQFAHYHWGYQEYVRNKDGDKIGEIARKPNGKPIMTDDLSPLDASERVIEWRGLDWAPDHNAGRMAKGAFVFQTFHPVNLAKGMFTGETMNALMWIGTDFGRNIHDKESWGELAKIADRFLSSDKYKKFVVRFQKLEKIANMPKFMMQDIQRKIKQKATEIVVEKVLVKIAVKIGAEKAFRAVAAVFTEGASEVVFWVYEGVNFVTGGALDKAGKAVTRTVFETAMSIFLAFIGILVLIYAAIGVVTTTSWEAIAFLGTAYYWAPDSDYHPKYISRKRPGDPPPSTWEDVKAVNCINGNPVPITDRVEPVFSPTSVSVQTSSGRGIDVSHWNGNITWNLVKTSSSINFAFMKASEGTYMKDGTYPHNFAGAKASNIKRSAYHFFSPNIDGYSQANYFMNYLYETGGGDFGDLQVVLDVEPTSYMDCVGTSISDQNMQDFLDQVEAMLGYKAIIYTNKYAWEAMVANPTASYWSQYPLWDAQYANIQEPTNLPPVWNDWLVWQCATGAHNVAGITSGNLDRNVWKGTKGCW